MGIVCESVCCKPNRSLIHILEVAEVQNKKYFSLSWPLIRECFKMYWYIPALSFVMYFFAGIFPVLSNLKHIPELENYITESFNNLKFIYMALLIIAPVVSASIMMLSLIHI